MITKNPILSGNLCLTKARSLFALYSAIFQWHLDKTAYNVIQIPFF